jgi:hypothetical protein
MTVLAAARLVDTKMIDGVHGGIVISESVVASDIIFQGAFVTYNAAGDITPAATGAGKNVLGLAIATADNSSGSAGDINADILVGAIIEHALTATKANIGDAVFVSDDQVVTLTAAQNPYLGYIIGIAGTNLVLIQMKNGTTLPPVWTVTNHAVDRSFDANGAADLELADLIGTLILDLTAAGILTSNVS